MTNCEQSDSPRSRITSGLCTGFADLDFLLSGIKRTDVVILASRPAIGKTAFALNIARNVNLSGDKTVAVFCLEESKEQVTKRLHNADKLILDDTHEMSLFDLLMRCRKIKSERTVLDLIVIDYIQLMNAEPQFGAKLKVIAEEIDCPILALSQVSREVGERPDKRPLASDLRIPFDALEIDADQIICIYRDEVYHDDSPEKGIAEIIVRKNRHGSVGTIKLGFDHKTSRFFSLSEAHG